MRMYEKMRGLIHSRKILETLRSDSKLSNERRSSIKQRISGGTELIGHGDSISLDRLSEKLLENRAAS